MNAEELAIELIRFLQDSRQMKSFLSYMEGKGFDPLELENDIDNFEETF